jgi:hypothetical protein
MGTNTLDHQTVCFRGCDIAVLGRGAIGVTSRPRRRAFPPNHGLATGQEPVVWDRPISLDPITATRCRVVMNNNQPVAVIFDKT